MEILRCTTNIVNVPCGESAHKDGTHWGSVQRNNTNYDMVNVPCGKSAHKDGTRWESVQRNNMIMIWLMHHVGRVIIKVMSSDHVEQCHDSDTRARDMAAEYSNVHSHPVRAQRKYI